MKCKRCRGSGKFEEPFCGIYATIQICKLCKGKGFVNWFRAFLFGWL